MLHPLTPLHHSIARAAALVAALALAGCAAPPTAPADAGRPRIEKAADLPRHSYALQGPLEDIVRSPQRFAPFAAQLRRDTEAVLAGYDIPDVATRSDLLTRLAVLDYVEGRYAQSLQRAEQVRALQEKPADKLLSGLRLRAAAHAATLHAPGTPAHAQEAAAYVRRVLQAAPFDVVANDVRELKANAEVAGEGRILGSLRERLQPVLDTNGSLSGDMAPALLFARYALTTTVPMKATWIEVFSTYLAAHQTQKADIWAARDVTLPAQGPYVPVNVAVWDSGVDTALFGTQVLRGADGKPVVKGFDKYMRPADAELAPIPADLRSRLPQLMARSKGFSDLQANIDSAEASEVKRWMSGMKAEEYKAAMEELGLVGNYEHGTHVAGITLAGNPHARLVVGRIEFGHTLKPDPCPSLELARQDARNVQAMVDFFKRHQVRVVNMSFGGSVADVERELEECALGGNAEGRKRMARELFDIGKKGFTEALASAPGILFVAAAGNSNEDASFTESMPADIALPHVLTVGAVDQAGDEAGFTSYGPTVKAHANGYQVVSFVPGGQRVALSGTSMAAPQVAGLAAKLLAVKPGLTPAQVVEAITRTAERSADGRRFLVHPKKALAAVQGG